MRFYHVLLLLPISQTHIDFLDLSISQNFWRSHHVRVVVWVHPRVPRLRDGQPPHNNTKNETQKN